MNQTIPHTPFSTSLSGSARETELRLRNIFSGPKKRPPALFLALVFAACVFCGNLVSCQLSEGEATPERLSNSQQGDVSLDLTEHEPASVTYKPGEDPLSEGEQLLLETLFRAAEHENGWQFQTPTAQLISYMQKDGWVLGTVFVEDHLENTLILGIMDKETGEMPHGVFQRSYHAGVPNVVTFRGDDGEYRLLYTFNGQENGQYTGEAGVVRFDGEFMTWEWPMEGDARYGHEPPGASPAAYPEYREYWDSHLALLAPGGVDVYTVNPDFVWGGDEPMWQPEYNETFWYDSSSADLYFPYEQTGAQRSYDVLARAEINPSQPDKGDDWNWADKFDEQWEKEQEAKQIEEYQSVGVTMDGKNYYYQGQLVNIFLDQRPNKSFYTLDLNPSGTVNVKILRSEDGAITGAAYMTDVEVKELLGDMRSD